MSTETALTLPEMEQRQAKLDKRQQDLQGQLQQAQEQQKVLEEELAEVQHQIAEGSTDAAQGLRANRALEDQRSLVSQLRTALDTVAREHEKVSQEIGAETQRQERSRQEEIARPLLKKADQYLEEFMAQVADTAAPLRKRAEIIRQVRDQCPLLPEQLPVSLSKLAERVFKQWHGPRPWSPVAGGTGHLHSQFRQWVDNLLAGPVRTAAKPYLKDLHLQE